MGFGSLLKMKMTDVPGALSKFVLENFDPSTNTLKVKRGNIPVTRESVHEILGLPMGEVKFEELEYRKKGDTSYDDWKAQFENNAMVRLQDIKTKIVSTRNADMNFKLNFIAVLVNALLESSSTGKCNTSPLNYITKETDIANLDWCKFLIDSLVKTKSSFDPKSKTAFYVGPASFLVVCLQI